MTLTSLCQTPGHTFVTNISKCSNYHNVPALPFSLKPRKASINTIYKQVLLSIHTVATQNSSIFLPAFTHNLKVLLYDQVSQSSLVLNMSRRVMQTWNQSLNTGWGNVKDKQQWQSTMCWWSWCTKRQHRQHFIKIFLIQSRCTLKKMT